MVGHAIIAASLILAASSFFYTPPVPRWFERAFRKVMGW